MAEPDTKGEQMNALQHMLKRLMKGEVPKVESYWVQQLVMRRNTIVTASQWRAALPHMFVFRTTYNCVIIQFNAVLVLKEKTTFR